MVLPQRGDVQTRGGLTLSEEQMGSGVGEWEGVRGEEGRELGLVCKK